MIDKLKPLLKKVGSFIIFLLIAFQSFATDLLYVGEQAYYSVPDYNGILDAAAWYSDRPNDIMIFKDDYGATVSVIQYFSGTATLECQYAYHYYVGSKKYNQTGHARISISCKKSAVKITQDEVFIAPGETVKLSYTNSSGYKLPYPYWEVEDSKIATIDDYYRSNEQQITVKGIAAGTTSIKLYANTGEENPTCKVTVKDIPATAINLKPATLNINEGKTAHFTVEYTPKNATSPITWTIKDENVASISSSGTIKGLKEGTTVVTATTNNGLTATGTVCVAPQPSEVKLPSTMTLYKGYNAVLSPTLLPMSAVTTFQWLSDAPKVVSVDALGNVFAKSYGTANITVTTDNGKKATMSITVIEPSEELEYRNITKRVETLNELLNETIKTMK